MPRKLSTTRSSIDFASLDYLFNTYIDHHKARGSAKGTITHYTGTQKVFYLFLEEHQLPKDKTSLTAPVITQFSRWMMNTPTRGWRGDTQRSINTIHGHLRDIRAIARWLHDEELIERVPKVTLPKLPNTLFPILETDDLQKVFSCTLLNPHTETGIRNRALFAFMLDTAVRRNEAATLEWSNLNISDGSARILGKGNKERYVFFSNETTRFLRAWLQVRGEEDGTVFWLKDAGIRMLFDRIKRETQLEVFHAHQIRHTAITMMVRKGVDLHTVRRIAGHSTLTVTEQYLSLSTDDLKHNHSTASPVDQLLQQPTQRRLRNHPAD